MARGTLCRLFLAALPALAQAIRTELDVDAQLQLEVQEELRELLKYHEGDEFVDDDSWITVQRINSEETQEEHHDVDTEETKGMTQGDIIEVPEDPDDPEPPKEENVPVKKVRPWPEGIVWYKWTDNITKEAKNAARDAFLHWTSKTCIRFKNAAKSELPTDCEKPNRKTDSHCFPVTIGSHREGCNAVVGYRGSLSQRMNLGKGCTRMGTAAHELGHVLGLYHEHERAVRDEFVNIVHANIKEGDEHNFEKVVWRGEETRDLPYDLSSLMHYGPFSFSKSKDYTDPGTQTIVVKGKDAWGNCNIGQRSQLSVGDILTVKKMYGCTQQEYCVDLWHGCPENKDKCGTDPSFDKKCPKSCKLCKCKDKRKDCVEKLEDGVCPSKYHADCARTCGICGPSRHTCVDTTKRCKTELIKKEFKDGQVGCEKKDIVDKCPRSCGACPAQVFCYDKGSDSDDD